MHIYLSGRTSRASLHTIKMVRRISPIDNQRLIYCFSISPILPRKIGEISVQDG